MANNIQKFLDQFGVKTLWSHIAAKVDIEKARAETVEAELQESIEAANAELIQLDEITSNIQNQLDNNYDETIIGLSVDGTTVTYIKGDGSVHSFETQDTNTTYSLGTDSNTGLTKLYATTGSAEDGTMTQKAIKTELDKKVGVDIDNSQNTLIFTK